MSRFITITLIIWLSLSKANCSFAHEADWEFWNTASIAGVITGGWNVSLAQEFRLRGDTNEHYYYNTDVGITKKATNWLYLGVNFSQVYELKGGHWRGERRPHVNGIVRWKLRALSFEDRTRFERRIREGAEDVWRYRNKFSLAIPLQMLRLYIRPYLADEIFWDMKEEELNRNRFYVGSNVRLTKDLNTDIFYLWQSSKQEEQWMDIHVLGAKIQATFR